MKEVVGVGDVHIHTKYSEFGEYSFFCFPDSVEEPKKAVKYAKKIGLDVIAITDHNSIKGARIARDFAKGQGIEVIIGEEVTSREGHILALFIDDKIKPDLGAEETIELIHDQGGLAIAAHPFGSMTNGLGHKIHDLDIDGIEVFNALHRDGISNKIGQLNGSMMKKALLGSSDAHTKEMIGSGYTLFEGNTSEDLRKSIKKAKTYWGGRVVSLPKMVGWGTSVAIETSKMVIRYIKGDVGGEFWSYDHPKDDPLLSEFYALTTKKKILGVFGLSILMLPPVPLLSTIFGNYYLKRKSKAMLSEFNKLGKMSFG